MRFCPDRSRRKRPRGAAQARDGAPPSLASRFWAVILARRISKPRQLQTHYDLASKTRQRNRGQGAAAGTPGRLVRGLMEWGNGARRARILANRRRLTDRDSRFPTAEPKTGAVRLECAAGRRPTSRVGHAPSWVRYRQLHPPRCRSHAFFGRVDRIHPVSSDAPAALQRLLRRLRRAEFPFLVNTSFTAFPSDCAVLALRTRVLWHRPTRSPR